jgi:hypothetical protein
MTTNSSTKLKPRGERGEGREEREEGIRDERLRTAVRGAASLQRFNPPEAAMAMPLLDARTVSVESLAGMI